MLEENPLFEKGLIKVVKKFVKSNAKMQNYYDTREPESEEEEEIVEDKKSKGKSKSPKIQAKNDQMKSPQTRLRSSSPKVAANSSWMAKFSEPKRLEDINNHHHKL